MCFSKNKYAKTLAITALQLNYYIDKLALLVYNTAEADKANEK